MVILGYDGLEYNLVEKWNLINLKQKFYGKTNISMIKEKRTVIIWSSFLSGRDMTEEVLALGKNFWNFKLDPEETFFSFFNKWRAIDVPGFTYKIEKHKKERELMAKYFNGEIEVTEYDSLIFKHHKENKEEFFNELKKDYEIIMAYFPIADLIGHASFGIETKMKLIYKELDNIAKKVKERISEKDTLLIISDHGMKSVGRYGDHTDYGFWSLNKDLGLKNPKVTEFKNLIKKLKE